MRAFIKPNRGQSDAALTFSWCCSEKVEVEPVADNYRLDFYCPDVHRNSRCLPPVMPLISNDSSFKLCLVIRLKSNGCLVNGSNSDFGRTAKRQLVVA